MTVDIASMMKPDNSGSDSVSSNKRLADDMDTFLTLLTTQLQNQDPTNPMDSKEMTNQLVQFSQVEQQIEQNKNLEKLVSMQGQNATANAVNYIGRMVQAPGNATVLENGSASFGYTLPKTAETVTLLISDASGNPVFETTGETSTGRHEFTWDGIDSGGNPRNDGEYSILVTATAADKTAIEASVDTTGKVTGVESDQDGPKLMIGSIAVEVDKVTKILAANAA
jgi:flagellar basal-body rod modification protein FlgD